MPSQKLVYVTDKTIDDGVFNVGPFFLMADVLSPPSVRGCGSIKTFVAESCGDHRSAVIVHDLGNAVYIIVVTGMVYNNDTISRVE